MKSVFVLLMLIVIFGGICSVHLALAQTSTSLHQNSDGSMPASEEAPDRFWMGWSSPVDVSQSPTNQALWPALGVTAGGQMIYLAWSDGRDGVSNIHYTNSGDGGASWTPAQRVWWTDLKSWRPTLVVTGTTRYLAWADQASSGLEHTVYQMALGAGSVTFVPNEHPMLASAPRLALGAGGELHLVLPGGLGNNPDVLYSRRSIGATTWPTATVVFTHTATGSFEPSLVVSPDGETIHLVWEERDFTKSAIYYMRGQRSGAETVWQSPTVLSPGINKSVLPVIGLAESDTGYVLHVIWGETQNQDGYKDRYVRYSRSDDEGASWSDPIRIDPEAVRTNENTPSKVAHDLAITPSGTVCVSWHGFRSGVAVEAEEVYLTCSTDQGTGWETAVNVSRSPNLISIRPVLDVGDNGILHLVWQEQAYEDADPLGEYQIYYVHSLPHSVMLPMVRR